MENITKRQRNGNCKPFEVGVLRRLHQPENAGLPSLQFGVDNLPRHGLSSQRWIAYFGAPASSLIGKFGSNTSTGSSMRHVADVVRHHRAVVADNDWWALGQHNGLVTPLLDWTTSPYVPAYFAFVSEESGGEPRRAVFGISRTTIDQTSTQIARNWKGPGRAPIIEFVQPMTDENARLVNQGGLFTRAPDGVDIETWVRGRYPNDSYVRLIKLTIPTRDREVALRSLNRMNINHVSLFPDLYGASKFVNMDLLIEKY